jgi:O-antigen/teichoic acid export membrane protein
MTGLVAGLRQRYGSSLSDLRSSDTAKAAGLAGAMIINNLVALISTVVFARLLNDYAALAALVSYFLILSVAGLALQVATAREGVLGHLGVGPGLIATMKRWAWSMLWFTLALTVISILLRHPIASAVGVKKYPWAAALGLPAGGLYIELCILRGALQGVGDYKDVGISLIAEQSVRLVVGAGLAAVGLGVTGAYLGTPFSFIAMIAFCAIQLRRVAAATATEAEAEAPGYAQPPAVSLWAHVKSAWAPICGLIIIAVLQNIDIIAAKHRFGDVRELANSYAATAVAAKVLIWVAMGAGFYLVPEVSKRYAEGKDTRPVLMRALAIIAVCAVPVLLIFAFAATPLLRIAFGPKRLEAADSLLLLGLAFTALACTYLAIQYMLALKRTWFLLPLAAVAIAEPVLLLRAPDKPAGFAAVVFAVQSVAALLAFGMALRRDTPPPVTAVSEPTEARAPEPAPLLVGRRT